MIIVLIGVPGSGKGTQGEFLEHELALPRLVVGDMFRSIIENQEPEAQVLSSYISQGRLVPPEMVNSLVYRFMLLEKYRNNCILDGYPRSLAQAQFLAKKMNNDNIIAIYFAIQESEAIKRILGRFNCTVCKKVYNKYYAQLQADKACSACGSIDFAYRSDDNEQTINKRIQEYRKETYPIIDYYRKQQVLLTVDADRNQDEVKRMILADILKKV